MHESQACLGNLEERGGRAPARNGRASSEHDLDPLLSVVVPCYNEEANLDILHRRLIAVCESVLKPFELVLVNDGSTDRTWELLRRLAEEDPRVVAVNLSRNFGQQAALSAGLAVCRGERILVMDADLQDPPELLPTMLDRMEAEGADVVYGQRRTRTGESAFKRATAAGFYRLMERLSDSPIPRNAGEFRLISRRALDVLLRMPEHCRFVRGMIGWVGFRQVPILYDRPRRTAGVTNWPSRKMLKLAVDAITSFSTRPLACAGWAGAATMAFAVLLFLWTGYHWWATGAVSEWLAVLAAVAVLASFQLFSVAILGAYVGRLCEEARHRPLFVIEEIAHRPSRPLERDRCAL